ncbi:peptidase domain-containing ABC transporter [Rhizobium leguminosarum]|uniref:peptidase domain-containing ABC transporter n=1 Tax=Rhizobium leguminosarum TaxID=384 RepID=UPI001F49029C|nr:type I secretion system permease/ATPase [Rhizobium leguminosarum]UIJ81770.1 type I secretion system permease/ATPase [Rhizobium leguminosarum]
MNELVPAPASAQPVPNVDSGLACLCAIASHFRILANPAYLKRELALGEQFATSEDLARAAKLADMKARIITTFDERRLRTLPVPAIVHLKSGTFAVLAGRDPDGTFRLVDVVTRISRSLSFADLLEEAEAELILVQRRMGGKGIDPTTFGFRWFLPSIWRYRRPLAHVLLASLFVQVFALVTPLFFQVVIDKVLVHKGYETLIVLTAGLAIIGVFDVLLQFLRTYALNHTTNRIDVELGRRLFQHLFNLPMSYFETRPAGQTVARVRELETIRSFLTGQALFSAIDLAFTLIFIAVLFLYSWFLALIVIGSIPVYLLISTVVRPPLREKVKEKFNRGAESQQFLVEAIVGAQTVKASAVEPMLRSQWEEKLAAYVRTAFESTLLASAGQNAIQYVNKATTALLLLFGASAVINGTLSVGQLIAFNMISGQVVQPILRLSQLWQDFQQVQVSVERLGDILNVPPEHVPTTNPGLPPPKGAIELRSISFTYKPGAPTVLKNVSLAIRPGEVIGIVGASGSGKSTVTKLIQRLYSPSEGQVLVDGIDIAQVDPAWLRSNIGVVLQENLLFNRTIHDNIAFADPSMPRAAVMRVAKLSGADEFINRLPLGYDTQIEERGANLSGGQRQRIAIARALATNPPILIFDEATSALDYESERVVQNNMRQIVKGRTVILIAHRLATVRGCNRIIGMANGRIVETGTHDDLLRKPGGLYARLWALQTDQAQA